MIIEKIGDNFVGKLRYNYIDISNMTIEYRNKKNIDLKTLDILVQKMGLTAISFLDITNNDYWICLTGSITNMLRFRCILKQAGLKERDF